MTDEQLLALKLGGVALAFPLLAWAIGTPIVGRLTPFDREERFAASFGVGFAARPFPPSQRSCSTLRSPTSTLVPPWRCLASPCGAA